MNETDILGLRLAAQRLTGTKFTTAEQVTTWLGGVQAQDFSGAKWALAQRTGLTNDDIDDAYNVGKILRIHILRPTWHFVTPQDIRWMLALTAPNVITQTKYYYRKLELDDAVFAKSNAILADAVRDNQYKIRAELTTALESHGIDGPALRKELIIMRAELDGIICSGPMRGKQFTYGLLTERVPDVVSLDRDEACARLAERYFTSHGPATLKDFAWWSGLSIKDATMGLEAVNVRSKLHHKVVDNKTYWFDRSLVSTPVEMSDEIFFLQNYDEYVVAYADRSLMFDSQDLPLPSGRNNPLFFNCIIFRGKIVGTWKRTIKTKEVVVSWQLFRSAKLTNQALEAAFKKYETFIELPIRYDK